MKGNSVWDSGAGKGDILHLGSHRASFPSIAGTLRDCFGLPIVHSQTHAFKLLLARYYEGTYKRLLEKIVAGHLVHADETEVHVRRVGKAYVWVFTNLEEVVFMYRPSREGAFLHEVLKDFRGVLVSDFYAAYDSLKCEQQKCLIHLVRGPYFRGCLKWTADFLYCKIH